MVDLEEWKGRKVKIVYRGGTRIHNVYGIIMGTGEEFVEIKYDNGNYVLLKKDRIIEVVEK